MIMISAILAGVAALIFGQAGRLDVAAGLALGGGWSIAKLWLRARRLKNIASSKGTGGTVRYALANNFALYIMTAGVLATAFAAKGINWWAVVAGLFATNAVMIGWEALGRAGIALPGQSQQGEH